LARDQAGGLAIDHHEHHRGAVGALLFRPLGKRARIDAQVLEQAPVAERHVPPVDLAAHALAGDRIERAQVVTNTVGRAVGQEERADELVAEVEAEIADTAAEHPELEGASAMMATPYEGIYVYGPEDPRSRLLTDLGFVLPEGLGEVSGEEFGGQLSAERADLLDVDAIVWLDEEDGAGELGGPLYAELDVHTEGREVHLDSEGEDALGGATSFVTVLSLPFLLDGIVPLLSAAVDGDPATEVPEP
jgi:iron complex transport system substrate-binding protein